MRDDVREGTNLRNGHLALERHRRLFRATKVRSTGGSVPRLAEVIVHVRAYASWPTLFKWYRW